MDFPVDPIMMYKYKAEVLLKEYLLADSYVLYTAVLGGILMCKLSYDITHMISSIYFKGLFCDQLDGPVTFRSSHLSNFTLGVSVGYFIADLAMIFWFYPSLGGMEYVFHHMLSLVCAVYAMLSGEGQLYTYMVLISETTTPGINLRWFLDVAGRKNSKAYLINGIAMFVTWLVARIILFIYLFYYIFMNYDQVKQMDTFACLLISVAPTILFIMNVMWFSKILRGLKKTLAKRHVD